MNDELMTIIISVCSVPYYSFLNRVSLRPFPPENISRHHLRCHSLAARTLHIILPVNSPSNTIADPRPNTTIGTKTGCLSLDRVSDWRMSCDFLGVSIFTRAFFFFFLWWYHYIFQNKKYTECDNDIVYNFICYDMRIMTRQSFWIFLSLIKEKCTRDFTSNFGQNFNS